MLAYDIARCAGTTHPVCQTCRRREPGRSEWQSYIAPQMDLLTGECADHIAPLPVFVTTATGNKGE